MIKTPTDFKSVGVFYSMNRDSIVLNLIVVLLQFLPAN